MLAGRVGTHKIHYIAVRTAIASGYPIIDDMVIDTLAAHQVARAVGAAAAQMPQAGARGYPGGMSSGLGAMPYTLGNLPYVYPPPLFGRLDDPFFGFEPPLLSYAPWFGATAYRNSVGGPMVAQANPGVPAGGLPPVAEDPAAGAPVSPAPGAGGGLPNGTIEMTLDPQGRATLRGTVSSLADRVALGQRVAQTPGITEVIDLLDVDPRVAARPVAAGPGPPPPPVPVAPRAARPPGAPDVGAEKAAPPRRGVAVDAGDLTARITDAFARRPALADQPIRVTVRDGMASLTGTVPTVYEAMIAFRAVQQTPGIREVIDRLEFAMPDDEHRNPLVTKGRPEDVEPYLEAQLRHQIGDLAHLDSVRLRGDTLDLRGTLAREDDRPRLDATLRSMPILRGFRVAPAFTVD